MMKTELQIAADKLVREIFGVKPGENVVLTADYESNQNVLRAVSDSVKEAGAQVMVITVPTPGSVGKAADPDLPIDPLSAALCACDVWIEFNHQWLLYSTPFERASQQNEKLRYMCLVDFDEELMIRTIGHVETPHERVDHLITIRDLQAHKPEGSRGFTAFIPWVFCPKGTQLEREGVAPRFSALEYLRIVAMSRIVLHNIPNIQASWLTVGKDVAEIALRSGANDMGSIMIEENVVSSAGATTRFDKEAMKATITRAGFVPRLRNQLYDYREEI